MPPTGVRTRKSLCLASRKLPSRAGLLQKMRNKRGKFIAHSRKTCCKFASRYGALKEIPSSVNFKPQCPITNLQIAAAAESWSDRLLESGRDWYARDQWAVREQADSRVPGRDEPAIEPFDGAEGQLAVVVQPQRLVAALWKRDQFAVSRRLPAQEHAVPIRHDPVVGAVH